MSTSSRDMEHLRTAVTQSLQAHWVVWFIEGILLLALGMAAVAIPPFATIAVEIIVGWVFLFSGIAGLITTFRMRHAPGVWWSLLSAILGIAVGVVLLRWPLSGALTLTLILSVVFVVEGVASIMFALEHRRERSGRWSWMLASGIVDLILAGMIVLGFPSTATWAIGLVVGINMVFGGVALIAMALHARLVKPPPTQ
jgi:uncharacterized membrane protein HdeD (DUF308 family)